MFVSVCLFFSIVQTHFVISTYVLYTILLYIWSVCVWVMGYRFLFFMFLPQSSFFCPNISTLVGPGFQTVMLFMHIEKDALYVYTIHICMDRMQCKYHGTNSIYTYTYT